MGGKKSKSKTVTAEPAQPSLSAESYMGPIFGMLAAQQQAMQAVMANSQAMQASLYSSVPTPTTIDEVDYESENDKLRKRLEKQVEEADAKRKGVLGTILTSIDDEPSTVKSLLGGK